MVPTIFGNVTYLVDGKYQVTYTSEIKGYYTVAVTVQQIAEVQTVQTSFSETAGRGGTFTLQQTYNGVVSSTDKLAWDASAEAVRDAVMELPSCRPNGQQLEVSVKRTHQHEASPFIYAVTFVGYVGDMPPLVADYDQTLIGAGALVQVVETAKGVSAHIDTERRPIRNEVQRVRLTGDSSGSPDGTFALSFRGHTTAKMPVTATTDDIKAELEKLEVVGSVVVDKTATTGSITDLDITFVPQGPSVDVSTLSITSMVTNSVSEVTVAHANSISVQVAAGDTIEITGFVANTWANGIWTVVGAPTTTEFKFSAVEGGRLSPGASAVYTEIGFAASHMQGHMLVTAEELFGNMPMLTVDESTLIATSSGVSTTTEGTSPFEAYHTYTTVSGAHITAHDTSGSRHHTGLSTGVYQNITYFTVQSRDRFSNTITEGPIREQQKLTIIADGGSFKLGFMNGITMGASTGTLAFSASANDVEEAIQQSLAMAGNVTVTRTSILNGYEYSILFESKQGDVPALAVDSSALTFGNGGSPEGRVDSCDWFYKQTISTGAENVHGNALGGTFYVTYGGSKTVDLTHNITDTDMKTELEKLPKIYTALWRAAWLTLRVDSRGL
jgi:hypothetical protein